MNRPLALLVLLAAPVAAQAPPGTEVHLVTIEVTATSFKAGPPVRLTSRPGYDNQPAFTRDGRGLYFTSVGPGGPGGTTQADIYRVDLSGNGLAPVTSTPESEYSATVIPGTRDISVIRVERDSTQRLWAFPAAGGPPRLLLERLAPVGYQAWLDARTVGLYVLGSPATLHVADVQTGATRILLSGIGRALQVVPGRRALSVTQRITDGDWWIIEVDPATAAARPVAPMLSGAEYFVWLPGGDLLSASGSSLHRLRPGPDARWQVVATFPGLSGISRLALSGNRLAFVASEATP